MLEEELKLDDEIARFIEQAEISDSELAAFLTNWAAHPDYYTDLTRQVISNLSTLNVRLLNKLDGKKRFHLVKALCITVQLAFTMKQWEDMLGREDGPWYWENHGLFFSSLHGLIPPLNELQSQIAAIGEGFTGRIICLEGDSERVFLEFLHYATRIAQFDNHYFVYGGTVRSTCGADSSGFSLSNHMRRILNAVLSKSSEVMREFERASSLRFRYLSESGYERIA